MDLPKSSTFETRDDNRPFVCGVVEGFYGRPWTTEQRKELFQTIQRLGLNTYMYAPKDDFKHRAYWRELYSVEEADQLSGLISAAKEAGVTFVYALSPGLDIGYSSTKEVSCLKRKIEQVHQFGCTAFALLFDDIEPEISQTDKEVFQSYGHAQVSVTNEVYQSLNQTHFIFCPTEYCSARANPNVRTSEYLNTIGAQLHPDIDIMWTGTKVITKEITIDSILELTEVLRRKPIIWDNLHANDYDQKRIFLGPYSGRSTDLVSHLRGVLTNPNCEYEANFIPIHTIAQWSKCNSEVKPSPSDVFSDIRLETESESGESEDIPTGLGPETYHPRKALKIAIKDWLPEFFKNKSAHGKVVAPLANVVANLTIPPPAMVDEIDSTGHKSPCELKIGVNVDDGEVKSSNQNTFVPITKELVNSLVEPPVILNPNLEPMDCNPSSIPGSPKNTDAQMSSQVTSISSGTSSGRNSSLEEMQTDLQDHLAIENRMTLEDVTLLVDLFYLPFEHGSQGMWLLNEFQWLKCNSHVLGKGKVIPQNVITEETPEITEWKSRSRKFEETSRAIGRLFQRMSYIRNRSLLYDFYPYVWDIKGVVSLLNSYIQWLAPGNSQSSVSGFVPPSFSWFSKGYREAFSSGEQEPWLFRGGLTGELQRLLPIESASDLFLYKAPESPSSHIYTIRPYLSTDETSVFEVSCKTADPLAMDVDDDMKELVGSEKVGGFLCLSPELCFVVEDEQSICGYALAAADANQFVKKLQMAWIPDLKRKYPAPSPDSTTNTDPFTMKKDQIIRDIHSFQPETPDFVIKNHPSILKLDVLPNVATCDTSVCKRLLTCVLAALKANGSSGVHLRLDPGEKSLIEFYSKLGFNELTEEGRSSRSASSSPDTKPGVIFMGRTV